MQGFCLNSLNINDFLHKLRRKLRQLCERLIVGIIKYKVYNYVYGYYPFSLVFSVYGHRLSEDRVSHKGAWGSREGQVCS